MELQDQNSTSNISSDAAGSSLVTLCTRIIDQSTTGIVVFDRDGAIRDANASAAEFSGLAPEVFRNARVSDFVAGQHRWKLRHFAGVLTKKGQASDLLTFKRKNGRYLHLLCDAYAVGDGLFAAILHDVTPAYKRDVETLNSRNKLASFVGASPYPSVIVQNGRIHMVNPAFARLFSWVDVAEPGTANFGEFLGKKNARLAKEIRSLLGDESAVSDALNRECTLEFPDGVIHQFEIVAAPLEFDGKPAYQCTFVDLTERIENTQQVEKSAEDLNALVELLPGPISLVQDGTLVLVNSAFRDLFDYVSAEGLFGKDLASILAGRDKKSVVEKVRRREAGEKGDDQFEFNGLRHDGTQLELEARIVRVEFGGKPSVLLMYRDVGEQRKADALLLKRAKSLELSTEIIDAMTRSIEQDEVIASGLQACMKALGFESGCVYLTVPGTQDLRIQHHVELSEKILTTLSTQSDREGVTGYVAKTLEPIVLYVPEYPAHLPYKGLYELEGFQTVVYVPLAVAETLLGILVIATKKKRQMFDYEHDVLSRVTRILGQALSNSLVHEKLRLAELTYRTSVESVEDILYQATADGHFTFLSSRAETLLGHPSSEFQRSHDLWRTLLHPDDRSSYSQRISNQALGVDTFSLDYRILPKGKASYLTVRDSGRYRRDEQGNVVSFTGQVRVLREEAAPEKTEETPPESRSRILESIKEGVVVYDSALICVEWNFAMETLTGILRDQVVGRSLHDTSSGLGFDELKPLARQALQGSEVSSQDFPVTLSGEIEPRYIWARFSPLNDVEGKVQGVVGIVTDVTARRRLEHEAKESEQILRNVIDGMGDALMICDLQGKVWEVNREFSRITGYQRSKVLGMDFPYPWLMEEEMARFVKWIAALREMNELRDFDMTWKHENGQLVAMSLNTTLLRNALGEPVAMLNISRDITDRRRLGEELEKKNAQIELLNRIVSKANASTDFNDIFSTIAGEVLNLIPYDQINLGLLSDNREFITVYACYSPIGKDVPVGTEVPVEHTVSKVAIARQHGIVIGHLSEHEELSPKTRSVEEGFESQVSIPIFVNERVLGTLNVTSLQCDAFTLEDLSYLQPIAEQIGATIDRVRLFQRVSDDSKYIHNLLNSINSVVYTVDRNHRVTEVNKSWSEYADKVGLHDRANEESLVGALLWDIVPQTDLRASIERVMPQLFEGTLTYYAQEYAVEDQGEQHTYHLALDPMVINGRVTGLVLTHTDITDTKRTEAEIKRRNKELLALNAIALAISKSLHLDEVLRVAAEQIQEIVGAQLVFFYLRDERKNQLDLAHVVGLPPAFIPDVSVLPATNSFSGMVINERKPIVIQNGVSEDPRVTPGGRRVFRALGVEGLAAIPLQSKDKVLGALDVVFSPGHEMDQREIQFLLLICNQIGPAIENAVLYKEVQSQVQRITSLYMIGKGLTGALDARTLLEVVYTEVLHAIPVEYFAYQAYAASQDLLLLVFEARGQDAINYRSALESPAACAVGDLEYASAIRDGIPWMGNITMGGDHWVSSIAVPVMSKQKVAGVLTVAHSASDVYSDTHLRLLESIANLTEIALDKAMLYEDTITKSIEIQNRNKELDDFTYVVSHDLKEPLISIEGYSKILLKDYADKVDDEGKEYLGSVVHSSARMKGLIEDLLTLSRVGRTAEATESIAVGKAVADIEQELHFTLREKNIRLIVDGELPTVRYNPTQLSMVFRNLISNAMKFNDKPHPEIRIGVREEQDEFIFSVADNGIGIDKKYFDRIFMIFQRLHRSEDFRGTGAGLTIVKKIIENHKGRIWLESTLGEGTTFHFSIPKTPLSQEWA
jgi:PAS domain S-box-containing protein